AAEAAGALTAAGRRALSREAYASARRLLVRALELEPTLKRRYLAARAAWRLADFATAALEMERVRAEAEAAGDAELEARALTALSDTGLKQRGDTERGAKLAERALELLPDGADVDAHFDALIARESVEGWIGSAT